MRRIVLLLLSLFAIALPAAAREVVVTEEVIEITEVTESGGSERFVGVEPAPIPQGIARFGPFRVLDGKRAAMVDLTDSASPAQFDAMLRAYPGIETIEMIEVPGTEDDRANLKLGRMIRARGISTHVPAGGSVRSGGVELFLAGKQRIADPGAEFAVHAWADDLGREATDYPADAPENRAYIDYYVEMGMDQGEARAFYAMTNSVPNAEAKWLNADDMGKWVRLDKAAAATESLDSPAPHL
ncbi:MAG TPA: alpha/beta hydrolase [Novosphingobium sp.]|nr:alpha/beta hydrolase [Novosphingobium sp.]HQA18816.1 alpha/beta hydrolase [Novosphingobium sp.]